MKQIRTSKLHNERWQDVAFTVTQRTPSETIQLDRQRYGQTIIGFGGAFTESSAYNLSRISKDKRNQAIKAYFDPKEGLGYTIGRVSIHGCDFSLGSYLYIKDFDDTLESFDISRDQPIIHLIKDAESYAGQTIKILGSPWTPPFWMKDNQSPIRGGKLLKSYYQTWADYFVKFIESYESKGVHVEWISVQNEPAAVQRWDSCIYDANDEKEFVKVLGPTLERHDLSEKKILIWDHNRDLMVERATTVYQDETASRYVWGTAFHWYENEQFDEVRKLHDLYPDKHLLFTEGCQEGGPHFGEYQVGERYGRNMIHDLRNHTEGYIDWNLFLDETGGPNHVNNLCSAPVMIDIFPEKIVHLISYYYIGHFSKYVRPGAKQIHSDGTDQVLYVAFENTDGSVVVIVQNEHDQPVNLSLNMADETHHWTQPAHSISTCIF